MEKEMKTATLVDDDGVEYELEIIKGFEYKGKNYAVLYEEGCYDEECEGECECDEEDEECTCGEDCDCHDDGHIYVLEVVKGEDGKEEYIEISSELMEEIIPVVEKELYPTEE